MKNWAVCAAILMVAGCKNSAAQGFADGGSPTTASPSKADPEPTPKKPAIRGRCENETTDTPYGSLYFYPDKNELFTTIGESASRLPISVIKTEPEKITFSYKWQGKGETIPTTNSATVAWVGTKKWNFDFESIKDSVCHPMDDDLFYKKLPEVGIVAGKYLDAKSNDMISVVAESQKLIEDEKGKTSVWYYRVRSKSDDAGVKIFSTTEAPSDSTPVVWGSWTVSKVGEDILIGFNGKFTRTYSPVK
jgi:hypothetical protein